ncbi:MAG TPA: hypothetical protein VFX30_13480 [bacterium]|nr:hypothetical protein [bacterium]
MSINLTVGANGATTGRTDQSIPGDGDIDTRAEAEAALTLLPEGSTDTVMVGDREYTRAQLIELRDGSAPESSETPETETPPASTRTVPGDGPSHGISLDGYGSFGLSSYGHSGGGGRLAYTLGLPLVMGEHRLFADISVAGDVASLSTGYLTPGGESANSGFTRYGGRIGAALRYAPPILDHRLWASLGLGLGVAGFSTADSTMVSTPGDCVPGDFGRPDCEPTAGPRTGNAGTTGLRNPRTGGSRGTSGFGLTVDIPLTIGADVVTGNWGSLSVYGFVAPQFTALAPSDGDGISEWNLLAGGGIIARIGGSASEVPADTEAVDDGHPVDHTETELAAGTAFDPTSIAGLPANATVTRVEMRGADGEMEYSTDHAPWSIPAEEMTTGEHAVRVYYTQPGQPGERYREIRIRVGEVTPINVPEGGTGEAYGLILTMPARAVRQPDDMVEGHAVARAIPLGSIQTTAEFPEGAMYTVYVDGNPVGDPAELPRDRSTALTLPASTGNGPHQVEIRVSRPGAREIRYPARAVEVGPGTATLSAASVAAPATGTTFVNEQIRVTVTSDVATRARIFVGSHFEDVNLVPGANTITLSGAPRTWTDTGAATRLATLGVRVQPLDAGGALTGASVEAGSVRIRRSGGTPPPPSGTIPRPPRR